MQRSIAVALAWLAASCGGPELAAPGLASGAPSLSRSVISEEGVAGPRALEAQPCLADARRPYYGGLAKCPSQARADAAFVAAVDRERDREQAALELLDLGLRLLEDGLHASAMLRFNQVFLLLPEHFGAPAGFAAAATIEGDLDAARTEFARAYERAPEAMRARLDRLRAVARCNAPGAAEPCAEGQAFFPRFAEGEA